MYCSFAMRYISKIVFELLAKKERVFGVIIDRTTILIIDRTT